MVAWVWFGSEWLRVSEGAGGVRSDALVTGSESSHPSFYNLQISSPPPSPIPQVIGIHQRYGDLRVNACKAKQLTNMRAAGKDATVVLDTPKGEWGAC